MDDCHLDVSPVNNSHADSFSALVSVLVKVTDSVHSLSIICQSMCQHNS